ncbi:hypothetical protein GOBAR_AA38659 [Gossypium barbadense]|uniref:RRP15-like protein n=1 Tax=Gossypium barbadense TaxID=3634 RepID=A0A2P5VT91_GOSBA|nr:hypothetical protein GOBAR_AA38659 [Gossypium barbadense]
MVMEEGSTAVGKRKRNMGKKKVKKPKNKKLKMLEGKGKKLRVKNDGSEEVEIQPGVMKFTDGVRAFRLAFKNIIKRNVADDSLGPVLSGHKQLVAKKLAEEEAERKVKGEAKKEKHLVAEKGHFKPANYLDSHEKFLIGIATKGGNIYFSSNVNKAQKAQKGLDPSRSKDAKVIRRRRKEAFFSELGKTSHDSSSKGNTSSDPRNEEEPAWAPLRDNYMLTNPKLKNWDKTAEAGIADDAGRMSGDSGSDD